MSKYKQSIYNTIVTVDGQKCMYNTLCGACIDIDSFNILVKQDLQALVKMQFFVPEHVDEFTKLTIMREKEIYSTSRRSFFIAPTMACNFCCPYCYAPKINTMMDEDIGHKVSNFIIDSSKKADKIDISWVGGEPLLNLTRIVQINTDLLCHLGKERFSSSVVTNGYYMTQQNAQKLAQAGVNACIITVDGDRKTHNLRRVGRDGKGTFDTIISNICSILGIIPVTIRINVDDTNIDSVEHLINYLKQIHVLSRATVSIVPIQKFIENNKYTDSNCAGIETLDKLDALIKNEDYVMWGGPDPMMHCCSGVKVNDLSIGPDGKFYACPIAIGNEKNIIGSIDSPIPTEEYYSWHKPIEVSSQCRECAYLPLCVSKCHWQECKGTVKPNCCVEMQKAFRREIQAYIVGEMR